MRKSRSPRPGYLEGKDVGGAEVPLAWGWGFQLVERNRFGASSPIRQQQAPTPMSFQLHLGNVQALECPPPGLADLEGLLRLPLSERVYIIFI